MLKGRRILDKQAGLDCEPVDLRDDCAEFEGIGVVGRREQEAVAQDLFGVGFDRVHQPAIHGSGAIVHPRRDNFAKQVEASVEFLDFQAFRPTRRRDFSFQMLPVPHEDARAGGRRMGRRDDVRKDPGGPVDQHLQSLRRVGLRQLLVEQATATGNMHRRRGHDQDDFPRLRNRQVRLRVDAVWRQVRCWKCGPWREQQSGEEGGGQFHWESRVVLSWGS
jgi:hypothetical protein